MEDLNHALFLWLNATEHPSTQLLAIATFFAEYAIWALPVSIGFGWLRGNEHTRKILLEATASGLAGLLINQIIGLAWQHPRLFMIGLGNTLIPHVADSSCPSDHLTLLWGVAFSFLTHRSTRQVGMALAFLGLPVAWARIYLGVHFPLDIVSAALVAMLSACLVFRESGLYLPVTYSLAISVHRVLFGKLIEIGWVRK
ncbi:undecaprenyl-diphosphatase [Undibacterium jejuense]|uniref:Undecaprenyl-diphosphatase n=1 Tax=Undibacterium jejuense TaxID=1344949 RepID=A0A923HMI6_9BURK|nr:undecaprenyl-diphosphatase [Undibacterium jejuense]MBC3862341.1 undecaprenyl-diphosphatase [Undibacterium jejuense]